MGACSFSHTEGGGGSGVREGFHHLRKALPCLKGGGGGLKKFLTRDFNILKPPSPLPVIDDRSHSNKFSKGLKRVTCTE